MRSMVHGVLASLGRARLVALLLLAMPIHPQIAGAAAETLLVVAPQPPCLAQDLLTWHIQGAPASWYGADLAHAAHLVVVGPDHQPWRRAAFPYRAFHLHPVDSDPKAPELDPQGPLELQARHTPRSPGEYTWTLLGPDGTSLASGRLQVGASTRPMGPLGHASFNRRLLAFADGAPFIPIGPNIAWADAPDRVARFATYLDKLVAVGGNHTRLWMSSWCGQIEGDTTDHWRLDQAWLLDQLLELARRRNVRVTVVFDNHYDLVHGTGFPYGASTVERQKTFVAATLPEGYVHRLRYILARWGADDTILAWELFNELDMAQPVREKCIPWAKAAVACLKDLDADGRLRTISWAGDDFDRISDIDGMDLTQVHRYVLEWADPSKTKSPQTRDGVGMLIEPMEVATSIGKPYCFGELGYQAGGSENKGNELDEDGLLLRQQAWAGLLLGGYGSGMNWWWDSYIDARGLWSQYRGLSSTVSHLAWSDPDLVPLEPNALSSKVLVLGWVSPRQGLIWPQPHSDTWYEHLVLNHQRQGLTAPVTVGLAGFLADTAFTVHWLDMIDGRQLSSVALRSTAAGQLTLMVMPPDLDRVAWIEATPP